MQCRLCHKPAVYQVAVIDNRHTRVSVVDERYADPVGVSGACRSHLTAVIDHLTSLHPGHRIIPARLDRRDGGSPPNMA